MGENKTANSFIEFIEIINGISQNFNSSCFEEKLCYIDTNQIPHMISAQV